MDPILAYVLIMIAVIALLVWTFWSNNDDPYEDDGIPDPMRGVNDDPLMIVEDDCMPEDENFETPVDRKFRRYEFLCRLERTGFMEDDEKRELHDLRLRFGRMR